MQRAASELEMAGLEVRDVPLKLLLPWIDHASIEEDESLRERWASLLAHAAVANDANDIPPAFVDILSQLTPGAAIALELIADTVPLSVYANGAGISLRELMIQLELQLGRDLFAETGEDEETVYRRNQAATDNASFLVDLLVRQQLATFAESFREKETKVMRGPSLNLLSAHGAEVHITKLGIRFLAACRPPGRVDGGPVPAPTDELVTAPPDPAAE